MNCTRFRITNTILAFCFLALFAMGSGSISTYIGAMITTIEKRFGYNSMEIGAIMGANDIGFLLTVIFVAYFASRKERKAMVLSMSAIGLWLSSMIYTLPFFIFGSKFDADSLKFVNKSNRRGLCSVRNYTSVVDLITGVTETTNREKYGAFCIFMLAGIINGVASTPCWNIAISFLDEIAGPARSGIYIGLMYCTRSLSPIFGFLLGSHVLNFHESLHLHVSNYLPGQKDFKWIGAWWLGWLILGFVTLIQAPFLALLKAKKPHDREIEKDQKEEFIGNVNCSEENETVKSKFHDLKELLSILKESLTNRIFVSLVSGMIFEIAAFICLYTFFTKFLEFHYRVSTSMTNVLTAFCLAGSSVISALISGVVSRVFKTSIRNMNRYHALVNTISALGFPFLLMFTCPSAMVVGFNKDTRLDLCSQNCPCPISKLQPVCLNSTTIFSPCIAGCRSQFNETFFMNCGCGNDQFARKGFCEGMCSSVYGFLAAFFIIKVVGSIATVQFTQVLLRLTEPKNQAIYLSIIGVIYGICGFVLPPMAGLVLDTACTHMDVNKFGTKSNCLIYDNDRIRYLIIGVAFGLQVPSSILYILAWIYTPPNYSYEKKNTMTSKIQSELTSNL